MEMTFFHRQGARCEGNIAVVAGESRAHTFVKLVFVV